MTVIWMPSENYNPRPAGCGIEMLILHTAEGSLNSDMFELHDTRRPLEYRVSSHAYACRNGDLIEMVKDVNEAWHAGYSLWGGRRNVNPWSLGLETEHRSGQNWPDIQKQTIADWCKQKIALYHIQSTKIAAHRWIAPDRKHDPSDWGDAELRAWIAGLYVTATIPAMVYYRAKVNTNVRQGPGTQYPVALVMQAGETAGFDTAKQGEVIDGNGLWLHRADGIGFCWSGLLSLA